MIHVYLNSDGLIIRVFVYKRKIIFQVWSGRSFNLISTILGDTRPINCAEYHPYKEFVVTGGWRGKIIIWDLVKLEKRAVLHGGPISGNIDHILVSRTP